MNIGILIPGFSDGEQDWCIPVYLNLVRKLAQTDTMRVFALRYPARKDRYSVYQAQVFTMGGNSAMAGVQRWTLLAQTIAAVVRQHHAQPFDVLHAIWADETGFAACVSGKLIGVPVVVSVAGGELVGLPGYGLQSGRVSRWLVAQALRRADCVTVPCQYAAALINKAAIPTRHLEIVPLGVDTTLFHPGQVTRSSDRILAVGSLTAVKRHDHLIDTLSQLPGITLDIVGEGPRLRVLQAQAQSLGTADRVIFHGGISHDALPRFYQQAALHVLSSVHEAFGMVTIEAAACGLPTAGYALGVMPELPGASVSVNDKDALTAAIRDLLSDPDRRTALGESAQCQVQARYTLETMTNGMRKVYSDLI